MQLSQPERRVRTLRLSAPTEVGIRRTAVGLEDALRTASLPGVPTHGLTVVRRLDLGVVPGGDSSVALARRIDERFGGCLGRVARAGTEEASRVGAVWFRDEWEPYVLAVDLLLGGADLDGWYWPSVLPGVSLAGGAPEAAVSVLEAAARRGGLPAVARVLDTAVRVPARDRFLARWEEGAIVRICGLCGVVVEAPEGWTPIPASTPAAAESRAPAPSLRPRTLWESALLRWVPRWGAGSARGALLARAAVLVQNPCAPERLAGRWLEELGRWMEHRGAGPDSAGTPHGVAEPSVQDPTARPQDLPVRVGIGPTPWEQDETIRKRGVPLPEMPGAQGPAPQPVPVKREQAEEPSELTPSADHAPFSPWAGLVLLVQALERLGMERVVAENPVLADANLPPRVLWACAERSGIPASDPILAFLSGALPEVGDQPVPFVAPPEWEPVLSPAGEGPLQLRKGREVSLLWDPKARLPLAWWCGGDPPELPAWVGARELVSGPPVVWPGSVASAVAAFQLALLHLVRRHGRTFLRSLVRRPGRVAATLTHLDVIFSHRLVDVRVRRAGLDVNPGWVPWLGKVVTLHYDYEDAHGPGPH